MSESRVLEFKEEITNTFLKTVSAFANYCGGEIKFGIDDNGKVVGLKNYDSARLDIENKINDSISPKPDYSFIPNDDKKILSLIVEPGEDKPYYYKGKAYKRNDTATVEIDRVELNRLILLGSGKYYEELPSKDQALTFEVLEQKLIEKIGICELNKDILKTLSLFNSDGYTRAAAILADNNRYPGIDIVKFGENISVIQHRKIIEHRSIIEQYGDALQEYRRYYQKEIIEGFERKLIQSIPEDAFREAIANALIHRTWDVSAHIRVAMYDDRIEIMSPGGLPANISINEYLKGQVSILRNPIIANVFFRLNFIEMFGTGITRIKELYKNMNTKPQFEVFENSIKIVLPCVDKKAALTLEEDAIIALFGPNELLSSGDLVKRSGLNKSKVLRLVKNLVEKRYIQVSGEGRSTKYCI